MCSTMFIAALFVIARTWKQPRCLSAKEWIKKIWNIYTMEYYSAVKKQKQKQWHLEVSKQMDGTRKNKTKQNKNQPE